MRERQVMQEDNEERGWRRIGRHKAEEPVANRIHSNKQAASAKLTVGLGGRRVHEPLVHCAQLPLPHHETAATNRTHKSKQAKWSQ